MMTIQTWREFLVKHAKFPFPPTVENSLVSIKDISELEVGLIERGWNAKYAVRDETLVQKLCHTLDNILGDTLLPDDSEDLLLSRFGRRLQFYTFGKEIPDHDWSLNDKKFSTESGVVDRGFFPAASVWLDTYSGYSFRVDRKNYLAGGRPIADYLVLVDDERSVLVEAESPSVMKKCAQNENAPLRLWLTRFVGSGSAGNVWQCRFDNSDGLFAIKVVELLDRSDVERRQRFYNEFGAYLTLEKAYKSEQLQDRITPRCYGAFVGDGIYVLILELFDDTLNDWDYWDELNDLEREQMYGLVRDLHRVGIVHGDLEPRNIARAPEGGFHLIDFTEVGSMFARESWANQIKLFPPASVLNCKQYRIT